MARGGCAMTDEIRCECCGGALKIVCAKNGCNDPMEQRRKAKGPIPPAPPGRERGRKSVTPPPLLPGICNVPSCDAPVVEYSGRGRPPKRCEQHWNPVSMRRAR